MIFNGNKCMGASRLIGGSDYLPLRIRVRIAGTTVSSDVMRQTGPPLE